MTITRADETYLINDTYKDCAVSGNIVYHTDGSKNISVSLNKDDKYSYMCLDKISEFFVIEDIKMMSQELKDILGNAFMKAIATYVDKYEPYDNLE